MRTASRIVAEILAELREHCKPGLATRDLDRISEERTLAAGAKPAFKGYRGFPRSLCTSINQEVVHGIPGKRILQEGDIVGLDFGVIYEGYYGDAAITRDDGDSSPRLCTLLLDPVILSKSESRQSGMRTRRKIPRMSHPPCCSRAFSRGGRSGQHSLKRILDRRRPRLR